MLVRITRATGLFSDYGNVRFSKSVYEKSRATPRYVVRIFIAVSPTVNTYFSLLYK